MGGICEANALETNIYFNLTENLNKYLNKFSYARLLKGNWRRRCLFTKFIETNMYFYLTENLNNYLKKSYARLFKGNLRKRCLFTKFIETRQVSVEDPPCAVKQSHYSFACPYFIMT